MVNLNLGKFSLPVNDRSNASFERSTGLAGVPVVPVSGEADADDPPPDLRTSGVRDLFFLRAISDVKLLLPSLMASTTSSMTRSESWLAMIRLSSLILLCTSRPTWSLIRAETKLGGIWHLL